MFPVQTLFGHEPEIPCEIKVRNHFENSTRTGSKVGNLLKISIPLLSLMRHKKAVDGN